MRITCVAVVTYCMLVLVQTAEEPTSPKKDKRQLEYALTQPSGYPGYHLERRISNGPYYPPPQYYPGPRPYRKGRPYSLAPPPYAVQMEPLIHYSQRDPLYESATNTLSPNIDAPTDQDGHNQVDRGDTIYIPHKPFIKVVEKPVYIKEPEPIIEIIIKESNISLPAPPTEAPLSPQKKKKEEVQVFYVKYKKNPNGYGKDAVIYDRPIPAIAPVVPDDEPEHDHHETPTYANEVTEPPRPSTTLRTIIKPDSEVYHSPGNNVKVTFGKESFDYSKRSSKPEDYSRPPVRQEGGRQLSSFSDVYFKQRPSSTYFPTSSNEYRSEVRAPQSYRPFSNYPSSSNQYNSRPPNREFNNRSPQPPFFPQPKYNSQSPKSNRPSPFPNFSHSISHPPPPQFQAQQQNSRYQQHQFSDVPPPGYRKPVPYTPFENLRPSQPSFSQSLPAHQSPTIHKHQANSAPQNVPFRPETHFNQHQQLSGNRPSFAEVNNQFNVIKTTTESPTRHETQQSQQQQHHQQLHQSQPHHTHLRQPQPQQQHQVQPPQQQHQYQEHLDNLRTAQNVLPPGGELLQSLPKFEQHLFVDPTTGQLTQNLPLQGVPKQEQSFRQIEQSRSQYYSASTTTTTSTTSRPVSTTAEPEKPSTTTKDPKVLEAQLPDEVPEDLRQQLLSSGILNHADISILDYDKVGDIPLSALPPDQLANFYGAGGAQQLAAAGSEHLPQVAALTARKETGDQEMSAEESEISEVAVAPATKNVEMKVVKYNPDSDKGRQVQEAYIQEGAKQVDPVVLNDNTYNRYLPLKVNGTQFPIPDVPELKGKQISSVVVLAPISYDFSSKSKRRRRETTKENDLQLIQNQPLKQLLIDPSRENYRNFLDSEKQVSVAKQAVILLVTTSQDPRQEKEIYMYDIATKTVSKLSGELSSAFVDAAEANSSDNSQSR